MSGLIECVIAGGPQHGVSFLLAADNQGDWPLRVKCADGHACVLAGRRSSELATRLVFLHPSASGKEFLSMLVAPVRNKVPRESLLGIVPTPSRTRNDRLIA